MHLLIADLLDATPQGTVLLLVPNAAAAAHHLAELSRMAPHVRTARADGTDLRAALAAQIVIATPTTLHERLLRHHDRAWRSFWAHLRLIAIRSIHTYTGVAAAHLVGLLLRVRRLCPADEPLRMIATLPELDGIPTALTPLADGWRIISADDASHPAQQIAYWNAPHDRAREAAALALALARPQHPVQIICTPLEVGPLQNLLGRDAPHVLVAATVLPAAVHILLAATPLPAALAEVLASNSQLALVILGDDPTERLIAHLVTSDPQALPLSAAPPPTWVTPALNAYVAADHLLCAATERPLSAREVEAWGLGSILTRLVDRGRLVRLPEQTALWQPVPAPFDPYLGFDLTTAGTPTILAHDDQGELLGSFDPSAFDRWGYVGATLPPLRGWLPVIARDDEQGTLSVRTTPTTKRSLPLRRCTVRVRDEIERRSDPPIGWGRVVVEETISGMREQNSTAAPSERSFANPLTNGWTAAAAWIELPISLDAAGQLIGWSLVAAISLRTLASVADCVPAYDAATRRLYLIDAQPGGNGLAAWLFQHLPTLLPIAYDLARTSRQLPLFEPVARTDMDWLLALLGRGAPAHDGASRRDRETQPVPPVPQHDGAAQPDTGTRGRRGREVPPRKHKTPAPPRTPAADPIAPTARPAASGASRASIAANAPIAADDAPIAANAPIAADDAPIAADDAPIAADDAIVETPRRGVSTAVRPTASGASADPIAANAPVAADDAIVETPRRGVSTAAAARPAAPADPIDDPAEPIAPATPLPDAMAMVERLKRLREQREQREQSTPRTQRTSRPARMHAAVQDALPLEPRFHPGDRVHTTPYGEGEVLRSQIRDEHEILVIRFPTHGELTINPALNAVRLVARPTPDADDDPPF
jgi:hypothetical protein